MSRVIKIASAAFLAAAVFSGLVLGGYALASGDGSSAGKAHTLAERMKSPPRPSLVSELSDAAPKTAFYTAHLSGSCTLSSGTYSSNVQIDAGATVSMGANADVVINGDLDVYGSLTLGSGTLTVNGTVDDRGALDLEGCASLSVNPPSGGGGFLNCGGILSMNSASARLSVNGGEFDADGQDSRGSLTAGSILVNGDFYQTSDYSGNSFCPGDGLAVTIAGTPQAQRFVTFQTPGGSYLKNFTFSGVRFASGSLVSIQVDQAENSRSINCGGAMAAVSGSLNGHSLTLTAYAVYPGSNSSLTLGSGGSLTVNGEMDTDSMTDLVMDDPGDKVTVNGDFYAMSPKSADLQQGVLTVNGNFMQYRIANETGDYAPGLSFTTRILGSDRMVYFDSPLDSYMTGFELPSGASLDGYGLLSLNTVLADDLTVACQTYYRGSLNGHTLTVDNDATVPAASAATVGGGTLNVTGSLTVSGSLVMTGADDWVAVGGDFTANGSSSGAGTLTNGILEIGGNFRQSGAPDCFHASGSHMTVLNGSGAQSIGFAQSSTSKFAYLALLNASAAMPDASRYGHAYATGTQLDGLGTGGVGKLSPAFSSGTCAYMLYLPAGASGVTLAPAPRYPDTIMQYSINGGPAQDFTGSFAIDSVPAGGSTQVAITVYAANEACDDAAHALGSKTCTLTVEALDPNLGSLNLPSGSDLEPAFDPAVYSYTVQLPETAGAFQWAPTPENRKAGLRIRETGSAAATVSLNAGATAAYTVDVYQQDGSAGREYTVTFARRDPLAGISLSCGALSPSFNPGRTSYSVSVPQTASAVSVTAIRNGADCSSVLINGSARQGDSLVLQPDFGGSATATVVASDRDGKTTAAYTVTVCRPPLMTGIKVSSGWLSPSFDPTAKKYTVDVGATVSQVKITPVKYKTGVKYFTFNGKKASSYTAKPPVGGSVTVEVAAVSTDGCTKAAYDVTVSRAALVKSIGVSQGTLAFDPATASYRVDVPADTQEVDVSASPADTGVRSLTVSGAKLYPPAGGTATAVITAVATDKKTKSVYSVTVRRAPVIDSISVTGGTLSPAFDAGRRVYYVNLPAGAAGPVTVSAVPDAVCAQMTVGGENTTSVSVNPRIGETIPVVVCGKTAAGTEVSYTVYVCRAALVKSIACGTKSCPLTPSFSAVQADYAVYLPAKTSSVVVKAAMASGAKTLTINGKKATSYTVRPPRGGSVTVTIVATAPDGTQSAYTVTVYRAA